MKQILETLIRKAGEDSKWIEVFLAISITLSSLMAYYGIQVPPEHQTLLMQICVGMWLVQAFVFILIPRTLSMYFPQRKGHLYFYFFAFYIIGPFIFKALS